EHYGRGDRIAGDHVLGDRRRYRDREKGAGEVQHGSVGDGQPWRHRLGRNRGGDHVRSVVEAVGEVEGQRRADHDHHDQVVVHLPAGGERIAGHAFFIARPSMTVAAFSVASIARSSLRKMSLQRITTIGSVPPANSEARASRKSRSPSFSSRWISIQYLSRSLNPRRFSSSM